MQQSSLVFRKYFSTFLTLFCSTLCPLALHAADNPYFKIRVIDDQTGRGVPLVELKTTNETPYYTDSNGIVAFYEPGLMDQEVFFLVSSHGYEYPKDGFGMAGLRLHPKSGEEAVIRLPRKNLAERLYRITGQGIYRDSVLVGEKVPLENPVLNGKVMGQDSNFALIYKNQLQWYWGDTGRPAYPLGNFQMSGATSELPANGGLPPEIGVNLHYFVNDEGFSRPMSPVKEPGLMWLDGFLVMPDPSGRERLIGHYNRMKSLETKLEHGLVTYNNDKQIFEKWMEFDMAKQWPCLQSHPIRVHQEGQDYFYFPRPFTTVRVKADWNALQDQSQYETYSCLEQGESYKGKDSKFDRKDERLQFAWKTNTDPIDFGQEKELIEAGLLSPEEARLSPINPENGKPIQMHGGSVKWNDYRKKWIMIAVEIFGTSMLGEVWYAEADQLTGPWVNPRKIVTHDKYSFYNPVQHEFFDQEGGRVIYFEGTYTYTFSGSEKPTPRYDYNQIMYRLDLANLKLD